MIQIQTGEISNGSKRLEWFTRLGWGRCFVARPVTPLEGENWFFDNGAFRAFRAGESFPTEKFVTRLAKAVATGRAPSFAVLPDIVAGGLESLRFSLEWLDSGRLEASWDWFLAVQDGMTVEDVEPLLERGDIAGLFVGGTKDFKATASTWAALAHRYGLRCHYGRASGLNGLRSAIASGCDSADSAAILFSDMKFFRYAQVWLEESVENPDPIVVAWVEEQVARARIEEADRRRARKLAA